MGGEDSGVSDDDHRGDARSRLFHARADRAHRPGARPDQRRAHPLRARRRSGLPRRRARHPHRADPRYLRRRGVGGRSAPASRRSSGARSISTTAGPKRSAGSTSPSSASARSSRASASRSTAARSLCPTWRRDVEGPADLVEEVARINGYDKVPSTPLDRAPGVAKPTATRSQLIERRVRRTAAARGLDEAVTWSFISEAEAEAFGGGDWRLANPISEEMKVMRPSLLPGLIAAARRNLDRGAASVRLFEVGRRYLGDAEHPTLVASACRREAAARLADGQGAERSTRSMPRPKCWPCSKPPERRSPTSRSSPTPARPGIPGGRRRLGLGPKTILASFGELHPGPSKLVDAPAGAVAAEIYLDAIPEAALERRARAGLCAAGAAVDYARLRVRRSGRACRRRFDQGDQRQRQGGDHRGSAVRPVRNAGGPVAGGRSHAPAARQELHRRGDRRVSSGIVAAAEKLGARLRS